MAVRGKHILIADDYPDAIEIRAVYLRMCGDTVSTAGDGAEAVAQAEQLRPDLIVLDLEMPGISGFEAARRLRRHSSTHDIPLIAATPGRSGEAPKFDSAKADHANRSTFAASDFAASADRTGSTVRQPSHSAVQRAQDNG